MKVSKKNLTESAKSPVVITHRTILTWLKWVVTLALLYFIFTKIEFSAYLSQLKQVHLGWLLMALCLFAGSKYITVFRLDRYWTDAGLNIDHSLNLKLYLLGMFYNLFLPGGIGGDAYKGYWVTHHFQVRLKPVVQALLLDRFSGLFAIGILTGGLFLLVNGSSLQPPVNFLFPASILLIILSATGNYLLLRFFFPSFLSSWIYALGLSLLSQLMQLGCIYAVMRAIQIYQNDLAYQLIFLISSVTSVLPITVGGLGIREVTALYGAQWFQIEPAHAVTVSSLFFLLTALVSFGGIYYHFHALQTDHKITQTDL